MQLNAPKVALAALLGSAIALGAPLAAMPAASASVLITASMSSDRAALAPGGTATITITARNTGTFDSSRSYTIKADPQNGLAFAGALPPQCNLNISLGSWTCSISVKRLSTTTLKFSVSVPSSYRKDNSAKVSGAGEVNIYINSSAARAEDARKEQQDKFQSKGRLTTEISGGKVHYYTNDAMPAWVMKYGGDLKKLYQDCKRDPGNVNSTLWYLLDYTGSVAIAAALPNTLAERALRNDAERAALAASLGLVGIDVLFQSNNSTACARTANGLLDVIAYATGRAGVLTKPAYDALLLSHNALGQRILDNYNAVKDSRGSLCLKVSVLSGYSVSTGGVSVGTWSTETVNGSTLTCK